MVIENGALAAHVKLLVFIHGNAGRSGGLDIHLGQLFAAEQNLRLVVAGGVGVGDDLRRSASAAVEKEKSQEKALRIRRDRPIDTLCGYVWPIESDNPNTIKTHRQGGLVKPLVGQLQNISKENGKFPDPKQ